MAYRRLAVGVSALAISIGPAGLWTAQGTAGAAPGDPFTRRASALRVDPTLPAPLADLPTVEPFVANNNNNPCTTQDTGLVKKTQLPAGLGNAAVLFANTQNGPGSTAQAGVADVTITVPNAPVIRAEVLTSRANAGACTAGDTTPPTLTGESTVARVTVGTTVIEPVKGPQVVDLGPAGKLFLNQQTFSAADGATANNTVTQRALFLDTPVADVVIAEAIADFRGNPCDDGDGGGGGGGGGGDPKPQCSDGVDNDGDGRIDFPADPGCTSPEDDDEKNNGAGGGPRPQCSDGVDNDGDGRVDFPADPGCTGAEDNDERDTGGGGGGGGTRPQCSDGVDNDGDGRVDFPADPGCTNAEDDDERDNGNGGGGPGGGPGNGGGGPGGGGPGDNPPDCSDELDNDGDGLVDFPNDPGCASPQDDDETNNAAPQCSDGRDNDGDGRVDFPNDAGCADRTDNDERDGRPECSDGADNDRDGMTDFPADTGCKSATDDDEAAGFVTGGGGYDEIDKLGPPEDTVNPGERLRFGAVLPCDLGGNPGPNLVTSWFGADGEGDKGLLMQFKLDTLTRAFCRNDPFVDPENPNAEFDTYVGEGTGTLRIAGANDLPARAEFVLVDRGEPGSPPGVGIDYYEIRVFVGAVQIANGCCTLDQGNIQVHTPGGRAAKRK